MTFFSSDNTGASKQLAFPWRPKTPKEEVQPLEAKLLASILQLSSVPGRCKHPTYLKLFIICCETTT